MTFSLNSPIESAFTLITLVLFAVAILTLVSILHDVLPQIDDEARSALSISEWFRMDRTKGRFRRYRALRNSWDRHVLLFPNSRKRVLFGALLLGTMLSIFAFPIWVTLAGH